MCNKTSPKLTDYCVQRLVDENKIIINRVISNLPLMSRIMLAPSKYYLGLNKDIYQDRRNVLKEVFENKEIMENIKENLYMDTPIFQKFERLNQLREIGAHKQGHQDYQEYHQIYQDIIHLNGLEEYQITLVLLEKIFL